MLPGFETERLWLRPRTMADFSACLAMDRDPEVTRYISGPWTDPWTDPVAHEAFLKDRIETSFGDGLGYWSIFPKKPPGRFAGWILLIPQDGTGPEVEIGWRLRKSAWGHGSAPEAARRVAEHGLRTLGVARIVADIHPGNHASVRVAEKIGMTFAGDRMGGAVPCKRYVMTKKDIPGRPDP